MEHVAELGGIVTGFHVTGQCIDCIPKHSVSEDSVRERWAVKKADCR